MSRAASRPPAALLLLMGWWGYLSGVHGSIAPLLAKSFALSDAELARLFSWIGLASLLALALGRAADRVGRRRALLLCSAALPFAAAASAAAAGPRSYLAAQLAAYGLGTALLSLGTVVVAEALPAAVSARGQARAALALAVGSALPLLAAAALAERPGGWRGVWALGALPLLALGWLARRLPESRCWRRDDAVSGAARSLLGPAHRARALRAFGAVLAIQAAEAASRAWLLYHPVRGLGIAPRQATGVLLLGGALGLVGFRAGGWLADTRGRRPALLAGAALFCVGVAGFYGVAPPPGGAGLVWLTLSLAALAAGGNAALATFRAHAAELLPPPVRGTFGGLLAVGGALGFCLAMLAVAALAERVGGVGHAVTCVVALALPAAAWSLRGLPETAALGPRAAPGPGPGAAAGLPA